MHGAADRAGTMRTSHGHDGTVKGAKNRPVDRTRCCGQGVEGELPRFRIGDDMLRLCPGHADSEQQPAGKHNGCEYMA
jgi:hypothetical protein